MRFVFAFCAATTAFLSASAPAVEPVPLPGFRSIELHGGGVVSLKPASAQRVTILEGSSQVSRIRVDRDGKLKIDACTNRCPPNYRLRIQIETPQIVGLGVAGGGSILAGAGFAPQKMLGVAVNGGGRIDARLIDAQTVGAAVNGGGQALVRARGTLAATVRGGGEIVYWGNPAVAMSVQGGGAVRHGG